jgi:hypothetical protein
MTQPFKKLKGVIYLVVQNLIVFVQREGKCNSFFLNSLPRQGCG